MGFLANWYQVRVSLPWGQFIWVNWTEHFRMVNDYNDSCIRENALVLTVFLPNNSWTKTKTIFQSFWLIELEPIRTIPCLVDCRFRIKQASWNYRGLEFSETFFAGKEMCYLWSLEELLTSRSVVRKVITSWQLNLKPSRTNAVWPETSLTETDFGRERDPKGPKRYLKVRNN